MEFEGEDGEWVWVRRPNEGDSECRGSMDSVQEDPLSSSRPLKVVFIESAKHWTAAAPIGNGRLGAMVWGGIGTETLQLNAPHLNINLQMNYWPSLSCNLGECQEPLFDYIASLAVNGAKTARVLDKSDNSLVSKIKEAVPKLPPTRISRENYIMEWAQDFEDPDVHHRNVSHLFGLFPGHTITLENSSDLCKAAVNTLIKRGL